VLIGVDAAVGESHLRKVRVSHSLISWHQAKRFPPFSFIFTITRHRATRIYGCKMYHVYSI
jgi:hypothetical protein